LNQENDHFEVLRHQIYSHFIPHKAVVWKEEKDLELINIIPSLKNQVPLKGKTTVYICHEGVCKKPLTELQEMIDAINIL
jgi:uncharacterized protein